MKSEEPFVLEPQAKLGEEISQLIAEHDSRMEPLLVRRQEYVRHLGDLVDVVVYPAIQETSRCLLSHAKSFEQYTRDVGTKYSSRGWCELRVGNRTFRSHGNFVEGGIWLNADGITTRLPLDLSQEELRSYVWQAILYVITFYHADQEMAFVSEKAPGDFGSRHGSSGRSIQEIVDGQVADIEKHRDQFAEELRE